MRCTPGFVPVMEAVAVTVAFPMSMLPSRGLVMQMVMVYVADAGELETHPFAANTGVACINEGETSKAMINKLLRKCNIFIIVYSRNLPINNEHRSPIKNQCNAQDQ
jgi:hypothetical protein